MPDAPAARPSIVAVATMKDEAPYILEWVAWHRLIGIDHFVVFTNDCSDGTDTMLDRLAQILPLEHVPNPAEPGADPQHQALRRARKMDVVSQAEWIVHFDADEFLDLTVGDGSLPAFLAACDPEGRADAISLPWRYMGSHGLGAFEARPVTERFLRGSRITPKETHSANGFKTIFRPGNFPRFGVHKPKAEDPDRTRVYLNASGEDISEVFGGENANDTRSSFTPKTLGFAHGSIRHYAVKSRAEFLFKQLRGTAADAYQPGRLEFDYFLSRNINTLPMAPLGGPRLGEALVALEADPVLGELQDAARRHMSERVQALLSDPVNRRFLETGDTLDIAARPPGRFLCLGTHHKTGTIWMRRVLRTISEEQEIPMRQFMRTRAMSELNEEGAQILVHWDADFPRPLYHTPEARIIHVIRDPRDVLLSGMRYHRIAPHAREKYLSETRPDWGGMTYQDYLNALPNDVERLFFEMRHKHRVTIEEMLSWEFGRANTIELRYEDLITDVDCARFRRALERANIDGLDIEQAISAYWRHSLFGGLAKEEARDQRVSLHVQSGAPAQWETKMPREVAVVYAAEFGDALQTLGYADDDDWVETCRPASEIKGALTPNKPIPAPASASADEADAPAPRPEPEAPAATERAAPTRKTILGRLLL